MEGTGQNGLGIKHSAAETDNFTKHMEHAYGIPGKVENKISSFQSSLKAVLIGLVFLGSLLVVGMVFALRTCVRGCRGRIIMGCTDKKFPISEVSSFTYVGV